MLDRSSFGLNLQHAVVGALAEFRRQVPDESPYAVEQLWGEQWWGEELSARIHLPGSGRAAHHDSADPPAADRWSRPFHGEDVVSKGETFVPGRITFVHSIRDLLGEIRERPAMCLNAKTLTGLNCLLFGYEIACAKHDIAEAEQLPDDVPWEGFSRWLAKRYDKVDWSVEQALAASRALRIARGGIRPLF